MKYKLLLIPLLIFIVACSSSELPPEPTPLEDGNGITGNAVYDYTDLGWAPPVDIFDDNKQLVFIEPNPVTFGLGNNNKTLEISVSHEGGLVYNKGYMYLNEEFVPITFAGEQVQGSNWLSEEGKTTRTINGEEVEVGDNFVVAYSCKLYDNQWKCGCTSNYDCGDWMLQDYVVFKTGLPQEPGNLTSGNTKFGEGQINTFVQTDSVRKNGNAFKIGEKVTINAYFYDSRDITLFSNPKFTIGSTEIEARIDEENSNCYTDYEYECNLEYNANWIPSEEGEYRVEFLADNLEDFTSEDVEETITIGSDLFSKIDEDNISDWKFTYRYTNIYDDSKRIVVSYDNDDDWVEIEITNYDDSIEEIITDSLQDENVVVSKIDFEGNIIYSYNTTYYNQGRPYLRNFLIWQSGDYLVAARNLKTSYAELLRTYLELNPSDNIDLNVTQNN